MKNKFEQVIINTPERFIARHQNYRISIAKIRNDGNRFDCEISKDDKIILEEIEEFNNMNLCVLYCIGYIETNRRTNYQ